MSDLLDAFQLGVRAMFAYQAVFFALLAIGLNLHFGYTGLLNFGQIAFAMVGGYGIAISTIATAEALRLVFRSVGSTEITGSTEGLFDFNSAFFTLCPWSVSGRFEILGTRWRGSELWVITIGWSIVLLGC